MYIHIPFAAKNVFQALLSEACCTLKPTRKNSVFKNFLSAKTLSGGIVLIGASGFNNPLALSAAMRVASAGLNLCHTAGGDRPLILGGCLIFRRFKVSFQNQPWTQSWLPIFKRSASVGAFFVTICCENMFLTQLRRSCGLPPRQSEDRVLVGVFN